MKNSPVQNIPDPPSEPPAFAIRLHKEVAVVSGSLNGIKQPSIVFNLQIANYPSSSNALAHRNIVTILDCLSKQSKVPDRCGVVSQQHYIDNFLLCVRVLMEGHQHPVFYEAQVSELKSSDIGVKNFRIQQPCLDHHAAVAALCICIELALMAQHDAQSFHHAMDNFPTRFTAELKKITDSSPAGFNTLHFLKAARDLDIPWLRLIGNTFQFGYGSASRLLDSSLTDRTPNISAKIARNKLATTSLLKSLELPVMDAVLVSNAQMAVAAATNLGYPVVVKPVDKDGGVGVSVFLTNADDVAAAFNQASEISGQIMVEKFFDGKDYRIQIVDGSIHGILERTPAGVIGNGKDSIQQLIEQQNKERQEADDDRRYLHPIRTDAECMRILQYSGLTLSAVPEQKQFVRLRGAANVANGGVPNELNKYNIHPDNEVLLLKTARLMRLDVLGIDLLIPDICDSWLDSGAAICEVNVQPQMFSTFHRPMLEQLCGHNKGHIPIHLVFETPACDEIGKGVFDILRKEVNVALYTVSGSYFDDQQRPLPAQNYFSAIRALLTDPKLQALVVSLPADFEPVRGWPFDYCTSLSLINDKASMRGSAGVLGSAVSSALTDLGPQATYGIKETVDYDRSAGFVKIGKRSEKTGAINIAVSRFCERVARH